MNRTITVEGMSCGHCEQTVEEALEAIDGVTTADADRETTAVTVEGSAERNALVAAIEDAGYTVAG